MGLTSLLLVRHGESSANVAATAAERTGAEVIDLSHRDADVPLTDTGQSQAVAVGDWLRSLPDDRFPTSVLSSPYRRAASTAQIALENQRVALPVQTDERLRDRELGIIDGLTTTGVETRLPQEAARRRHLGKFYYRPPGGESWADVALRVRSLFRDVDHPAYGERMLVVSHDAVITLVRYLCEHLTETDVLALARATPLLNASVSILDRRDDGSWAVSDYNSVAHLEQSETPVTAHTGNRDAFPH
ncbi:histidine phosphatase family protein [Cryobacterium tepidiphilum]|uniref:phosphoglycerate mutase (2,3-diphosphoglycerate-dependent) n=1 Tax=Cryobacterium tepidiphilum TaxID=2486026 RepID=A0A3M8KW12_9MICO|nr:histidine phosphatase family protein [Cryobacterium tepidiphilum]RNE56652.1 histidine phosphatase family protein [Cryobacterium tepidiphilum]